MKPTIIQFDDNAERLETLHKSLEGFHSIQLIQTNSVQETLEYFSIDNNCVAFICPGEIPGDDPFTLLREFKKHYPAQSIFVYGTPSDIDAQNQMIELGVGYFLLLNYADSSLVNSLTSLAIAKAPSEPDHRFEMKRVVLQFDQNPHRLEALRKGLGNLETLKLVQVQRVDDVIKYIRSGKDCIAFICPGNLPQSIYILKEFRRYYSARPVYVYGITLDMEAQSSIMELGSCYILPPTYPDNHLLNSISVLANAKSHPSSISINSKGRVLIVDDDEDILSMLSASLNVHGLQVDCVNDPRDALTYFAKRNYQIVLVDYNMRGMNGAQLTRTLMTLDPGLFIVGITASRKPEVAFEMEKAGCYTVVKKPFRVKQLVRVMDKFFSLSENPLKNLDHTAKKLSREARIQNGIMVVLSVLFVAVLTTATLFFFEFSYQANLDQQHQQHEQNQQNRQDRNRHKSGADLKLLKRLNHHLH